ncbi:uncharacterized protein [Panulirus ornatus]|uniref:uncharacterized protein n=1 Tax=Panulirus ornatus TaxID=150431 RepID=UPI003A8362C1
MASASCILVLVACLVVVVGVAAEEKDDGVTHTTHTEDDAQEVTPHEDRIKRQGFSRPTTFNSIGGRRALGRQQSFTSIQRFPFATSRLNRFVAGRPTFQRQVFQPLSPQQLTSPAPAQAPASAQATPVLLNNDPLSLFGVSQSSPSRATFGVRRDPASAGQPAGLQVGSQGRPNRQTFIRTQGQTPVRQPPFQVFSTTPRPQTFQGRPTQQFIRPLQTASQPFQFAQVSSTTAQPLIRSQGQLFPGSFRFVVDDTREDFDDTRELLFLGGGVPRRVSVTRPAVQPGRFTFISDDTREIFDDSPELIIGSQVAANLAGAGVPGRRTASVIRPAVQSGGFTFFSDDTREDLTRETVSLEVLLGGRTRPSTLGRVARSKGPARLHHLLRETWPRPDLRRLYRREKQSGVLWLRHGSWVEEDITTTFRSTLASQPGRGHHLQKYASQPASHMVLVSY